MILQIKTFPDEILRKKAEPVTDFGPELHKLIDDMAETMYAAPGYGIAAPQVGVSKRIIFVDETAGKDKSKQIALVNPEITEMSGEILDEEGCLSIPGEYAYVKRFLNVVVKYKDRDGNELVAEATERLSRILQHEIDHLDGKLFIDKLPMMKKETIKKRIRRRIQAGDYVVTGS